MRWLFLLFIVMPVIELIILLKLGAWLGLWPTVMLIFGTAFIGVNLLRQQGLKTFSRANQRIAKGEMPAQEVIEGIILAVGGALLLTPGLVTHVIGFSCLMPGSRHLYIAIAMKRMENMAVHSASMQSSSVFMGDHLKGNANSSPTREYPYSTDVSESEHAGIIDGEFERKDTDLK